MKTVFEFAFYFKICVEYMSTEVKKKGELQSIIILFSSTNSKGIEKYCKSSLALDSLSVAEIFFFPLFFGFLESLY